MTMPYFLSTCPALGQLAQEHHEELGKTPRSGGSLAAASTPRNRSHADTPHQHAAHRTGLRDRCLGHNHYQSPRLDQSPRLGQSHYHDPSRGSGHSPTATPRTSQNDELHHHIEPVDVSIRRCFEYVQDDLERESQNRSIPLDVSGSTALVVLQSFNSDNIDHVMVAHVGDSRAILIDGNGTVLQQSEDHKPDNPIEKVRIEQDGGEIQSTTFSDGFTVQRVRCQSGLSESSYLTRSFGDFAFRDSGVTSNPQIEKWSCAGLHGQGFLLAASGGFWEFVTPEEAAVLVLKSFNRGKTTQQTIDELLKESRSRWANHEGIFCDDISLVLIQLHKKKINMEVKKSSLSVTRYTTMRILGERNMSILDGVKRLMCGA